MELRAFGIFRYMGTDEKVMLPDNWEEMTVSELLEFASKPIFDSHCESGAFGYSVSALFLVGIDYIYC